MLAPLAVVTLLAAVPGISLRVIEDGSPAGPPGSWVLGEEVVSAWDLVDAEWTDVGELTFRLSAVARWQLQPPPPGTRVAVVVTASQGTTFPIAEARAAGRMTNRALPRSSNWCSAGPGGSGPHRSFATAG